MEVGMTLTGSSLGRELMREILNRKFSGAEDLSLEDDLVKRPDLTSMIICTDIGRVNEFAMHFRENLIGIIHTPMIAEIMPLNLGIVFSGEKLEAQGIIDRLRIDIDEILGTDNQIGLELLNPKELKKKRILLCDDSRVLTSELVHVLEARHVDIRDDYHLPNNQRDLNPFPGQSNRSQLKSTNSRFRSTFKGTKKGYRKMP